MKSVVETAYGKVRGTNNDGIYSFKGISYGGPTGGVWAAFALTGKPDYDGIRDWPAYTEDKRATMIFDNKCKVENDPYSEERQAWEGII